MKNFKLSLNNILGITAHFYLANIAAFLLFLLLGFNLYSFDTPIIEFTRINKVNIGFTLVFAMFVLAALRIFTDNVKTFIIGVLAIALFYAFALYTSDSLAKNITIFLITLFVFFLIVIAPFIRSRHTDENILGWFFSIIFALLVGLVLATIIYIGIAVLLGSIEKLFGLYIEHQFIYAFIYTIIGFNIFLSFLPFSYYKNLNISSYNPLILNISKFIFLPLTVLYFLVVFVYTGMIIVNWELPSGVIVYMVIGFSLMGILTGTILRLFKEPIYLKIVQLLWGAILLQLPLLAIAISMRTNEHGITINRYFVILIGIWLAVLALYYILRPKATSLFMFASIIIGTLVSLSPFVGFRSVVIHSLTSDINHIIATPDFNQSSENNRILTQNIDYLANSFTLSSFTPAIHRDLNACLDNNIVCISDTLGFAPTYQSDAYDTIGHYRFGTYYYPAGLDIKGYEYLLTIENDFDNSDTQLNVRANFHHEIDHDPAITLVGNNDARLLDINLSDIIHQITTNQPITSPYATIEMQKNIYIINTIDYDAKIILKEFSYNFTTHHTDSLKAMVLIKFKNNKYHTLITKATNEDSNPR